MCLQRHGTRPRSSVMSLSCWSNLYYVIDLEPETYYCWDLNAICSYSTNLTHNWCYVGLYSWVICRYKVHFLTTQKEAFVPKIRIPVHVFIALCLSVCLSVCHMSEFYRNVWTDFWHKDFLPCFKEIRTSTKITVAYFSLELCPKL